MAGVPHQDNVMNNTLRKGARVNECVDGYYIIQFVFTKAIECPNNNNQAVLPSKLTLTL